jgi:nicotinate-nucleotide adenylyltransferase
MGKVQTALFGGSFNPPHIGHVLACYYVLHMGLASRIIMLPVHIHPLGKRLIGTEHRENMCRLLFSSDYPIGVRGWERNNPTGKTIDLLKQCFLQDKTYGWMIGSDCLREKDKWKDFNKVEKIVSFIPINRFNVDNEEISSTSVRRGIARGEDVSWQVPKNILDYIYYHKIDKLFTENGEIK